MGCVIRPKIMSKFNKIKNFGSSATVVSYAYFQAFKFPDSMNVHFQCVIQVLSNLPFFKVVYVFYLEPKSSLAYDFPVVDVIKQKFAIAQNAYLGFIAHLVDPFAGLSFQLP